MCDFTTMILPAGADLTAASAVLDRHGRRLMELANLSVASLLRPGESYTYPGGNGCDCGTALGSLNPNVRDLRPPCDPAVKLRKKGWSEGRIQRWIAQKSHAADRQERRWGRRKFSAEAGPDGWCDILRDLLNERSVPYAGLFLHQYHNGLETETIRVEGRVSLPLDDGLPNALYHMEGDTLYIIRDRKVHGASFPTLTH